MVPEDLETFLLMVLMVLEGLVALLLVVPEALEVYLLVALEFLVVRLLVILVVLEALVVLLLEALVVLTVLIPEINPLGPDFLVVLRHKNLSISLLMVLLVTICHINITSMCNLTVSYLS